MGYFFDYVIVPLAFTCGLIALVYFAAVILADVLSIGVVGLVMFIGGIVFVEVFSGNIKLKRKRK